MFGINEMKYSKDPKQKKQFIGKSVIFLILGVLMIVYIGFISNVLITYGMGDSVLQITFMVASIIILCFTFLKAGSVIFQKASYEMMISLPVSNAAIVISRFMTMYMSNVLFSALVMLPGLVIYAVRMTPEITYYIYGILGIIILPLIPITISTGIGALITAVSARMKHKSLVSSAIIIVIIGAILILNMSIPQSMSKLSETEIQSILSSAKAQIDGSYIFADWYRNATLQGSFINFVLLVGVSVIVFVVMITILQKFFGNVCAALNSTLAKNNYMMQSLSQSSQLKALWTRELKRYFSCSVYVINTIVGLLLMAALSVGMCIIGSEQIENMLGIQGIFGKAFPFALSFMAALMPTTVSSISLEGKQLWVIQTLPVKNEVWYLSKVLVNYTIAAPFYVIAVVAGILGNRPSLLEGIFIALIPAVYILLAAVIGLIMNLKFPKFNYQNETEVIKQGTAVLITMVINVVLCLAPTAAVVLAPEKFTAVIMGAVCVILFLATFVLWRKATKMQVVVGR